jgi:hypothetical protein
MPEASFTTSSRTPDVDPIRFTVDGVDIECRARPSFDAWVVLGGIDPERVTLSVAAMVTFISLVAEDDSLPAWEQVVAGGVDPALLSDVIVWLSGVYAERLAVDPEVVAAAEAPAPGPVHETRSTIDDVSRIIDTLGIGEVG